MTKDEQRAELKRLRETPKCEQGGQALFGAMMLLCDIMLAFMESAKEPKAGGKRG